MRTKRIRSTVLEQIQDSATDVFVSSVIGWEIAIKHALGRLELPGDLSLYLPKRMREAGFLPLPVSFEHALAVHRLPRHHDDPFDRMLVAQAQLENLVLVTSDKLITNYDVRTLKT